MPQIRFERRLFIFREGMKVKKDLDAVRRNGWTVVEDSQFTTRDPDGTKIINLILRRLVIA
jgi:hypothetical protein